MVIIIFTAANAAGLLFLALYMLITSRRAARERADLRASIREAARRPHMNPDDLGISDACLPIRLQ
jgi:hypothetical protein